MIAMCELGEIWRRVNVSALRRARVEAREERQIRGAPVIPRPCETGRMRECSRILASIPERAYDRLPDGQRG